MTRFVGLGDKTDNGTPIFDEKHYVPQAWQLLQSTRGPISWGIEDNPAYGLIVHPPVAKQVIAIGEWIAGYNPWGWRMMSAVAGTACVLLLMDMVRRLSHGNRVAVAIVGSYAILDGVLLVSSRVGMLDMIQTVFIVAAAWALIIDQQESRRRLAIAASAGPLGHYGPYLDYRWWRLLAGLFLGLALGVKWSGLYYIAVFGLWSVFMDLAFRRAAGATRPVQAALYKDTAPALRDLVGAPLLVYVLSWRSWFAEETSVYRHLPASQRELPFALPDWLPESLHNYVHYQYAVLNFHSKLTTSNGHEHPWESKPWEWLVSYRPMLYYSAESTCADGQTCKAWMMLFGTPPIWWLLVPVVAWAAWRWLVRREGRWSIVVLGFIASWVPWVIAYDRQMYFFYATALIPFVLIGYGLIAADLMRWRPGFPAGPVIVGVHAGLVVAAFVFWLPIMVATPLPVESFDLRFWFPSWR